MSAVFWQPWTVTFTERRQRNGETVERQTVFTMIASNARFAKQEAWNMLTKEWRTRSADEQDWEVDHDATKAEPSPP